MMELPPGASPLRHLPVTRGPLPRDSVLKASVHQARRAHLATGDSLLPWRVVAPLMSLLPAALCPCSWHSPEAESLTPLTLSQHSQGPQGGSLLPLSRELAEPTRGGQQGLKRLIWVSSRSLQFCWSQEPGFQGHLAEAGILPTSSPYHLGIDLSSLGLSILSWEMG